MIPNGGPQSEGLEVPHERRKPETRSSNKWGRRCLAKVSGLCPAGVVQAPTAFCAEPHGVESEKTDD